MKRIILFGAGKSATSLIQYLAGYCQQNQHEFIVFDQDIALAESKIAGFGTSRASIMNVTNENERRSAISEADLVVSLLPPNLHILVAKDCLFFSKDLLTASYIDEQLQSLAEEVKNRGILFLSEMGLDPGIDHMSAMHIIDGLKRKNATIHSFHSHCGGLVAPGSDDNPWHYKITWNPWNVVRAGSAGAQYLEGGKQVQIGYEDIFANDHQLVELDGIGNLAWYANRDSLPYLHTYGLPGVDTFIRTTLRYPSFITGWNVIVHMGLTSMDDSTLISSCNTVSEWFDKKRSLLGKKDPGSEILKSLQEKSIQNQLEFLGFFKDDQLPSKESSAKVLLSLLDKNLVMHTSDKDMIVMIHEVAYEIDGKKEKLVSSLIVKGTDNIHTAMAKTVGTPLAIAATLILEKKINLSGLHIPVIPEIYNPVLKELEKNGIGFNEKIIG